MLCPKKYEEITNKHWNQHIKNTVLLTFDGCHINSSMKIFRAHDRNKATVIVTSGDICHCKNSSKKCSNISTLSTVGDYLNN